MLEYVGREISPDLVAEPTKLYPTKNKVEQINFSKMSALHGEEREYKMKYIKDLEMTKGEKEVRREFTEKDIQLELDFLAGNLRCDKEMKLKIIKLNDTKYKRVIEDFDGNEIWNDGEQYYIYDGVVVMQNENLLQLIEQMKALPFWNIVEVVNELYPTE